MLSVLDRGAHLACGTPEPFRDAQIGVQHICVLTKDYTKSRKLEDCYPICFDALHG